jgi:L-ribulose-5-phosphate 4-epimerase
MLEQLKAEVCEANLELVRQGLVTLTWGNASGIDRQSELVVIKPSGVPYKDMLPQHMVVVDMDGRLVEGDLRPSSDTPTHLALYRHFTEIGGVVHTHSKYATAFAQARREIPCLGTTHADHFHGPVPVTRTLTAEEVEKAYEANTGNVIVERFSKLDPLEFPGVLVSGHGPFTWGSDAAAAVTSAVAMEAVAEMAISTLALNIKALPLESYVLEKHYCRKHGVNSYYGQE